jgi:hypothetical protein
MKDSKKQKGLEVGIAIASNLGTKAAEELVVSFLGEGFRFYIAPAGLIVQNAIKSILEDFTHRVLSRNETKKIQTVIEATILEINSRLDGGATPRDDGFFTDEHSGRTKAEEILEGVLLKARDQHEEKKLIHFGYFYANLAFRSDIPPTLANFFLKAGNALSYRQFVLLRYIADFGDVAFDAEPIRGRRHSLSDLTALTKEEMELHSPGEFGGFGLIAGVTSYQEVISDLGMTFFELFNLNLIPAEDIRELHQLLLLCEDSPPRSSSEEALSTS